MRVSRSHHWLHQFQLVTEQSLKGATNYGNRATGIGTKHAVLRPRPRPGTSGLETKAETWDFSSRDQDRDLVHQVSRPGPRPGQNEPECTRVSRPWSRDHNTAQIGQYCTLFAKTVRSVIRCSVIGLFTLSSSIFWKICSR